jgi:hypothetical protein
MTACNKSEQTRNIKLRSPEILVMRSERCESIRGSSGLAIARALAGSPRVLFCLRSALAHGLDRMLGRFLLVNGYCRRQPLVDPPLFCLEPLFYHRGRYIEDFNSPDVLTVLK